jgi:hypothetical protein
MRFVPPVLLSLILAAVGWVAVTRLIARRRHPLVRCPNCHSGRMRPSWPLPVDRLLRLFSLIPYRCESCRARYYALPVKAQHLQEWTFARR